MISTFARTRNTPRTPSHDQIRPLLIFPNYLLPMLKHCMLFSKYCQTNLLFTVFSHIMTYKTRASVINFTGIYRKEKDGDWYIYL